MQLLCILFGEGRAVADRAFISLDHDDDQSLENADDECRCLDDDRTPVLRHCKLHSPSESDFGDCVAVLGHLVFELVRNTHCNHRVTEFLGEEPSSCISLALVSYLTSQLPKLREDYVSVLDQAYCFIAEEQNNAELNRCGKPAYACLLTDRSTTYILTYRRRRLSASNWEVAFKYHLYCWWVSI